MTPFQATITYDATPEQVAAMLADPAFVERKVAASRPVSSAVDVTTAADGGFTVRTDRSLPTADLPPAVQSLIGRTIDIQLVETWGAAQADGSRAGTVTLDVVGKPARATGAVRLGPSGPGQTVVSYEGGVEARIPLLGRKLEEQAVAQVQTVFALERSVGTAWLTEH